VSQDTQLCLWDITEDILRPHHRVRLSTLDPTSTASAAAALKSIASETVQMNGDVNSGSPHPLHKENHDSSLSNNSHTKLSNSNNKLITNNCEDVSGGSSTNKKIGNSSNNNNINNNNNLSATTKETKSEEKSNSNHHHSSAFNTLTQRFTNFSFGSDKSGSKSSGGSGKKSFSLTGSKANSVEQNKTTCDGNSATSTLRNKSGSLTTTFDAMKLIGSPACPRFDECPVLEPLICKKIAHERLTALIFREDCFLTACQDGFVYTWARPVSFLSYV
jgi:hypothetical protein